MDFMFGMSMRVLLLLTYIALPDPYFSTIVARKVSSQWHLLLVGGLMTLIWDRVD